MRVIAGKYRGRRLAEFRGEEIRPTPDRVKESLFQILGTRLTGARVLDLFCGSGALGIECLSRGASAAVFNDCAAESVSVLKKNLSFVEESYEISRQDFVACLKSVTGKFRFIFCDPPYKEEYLGKILSVVKARGLLEEGGLVVYESEREESAEDGFALKDKRNYGRTKVFFFGEEA